MASALLRTTGNRDPLQGSAAAVESAWETQASWRHGHFGLKPPQLMPQGPQRVAISGRER